MVVIVTYGECGVDGVLCMVSVVSMVLCAVAVVYCDRDVLEYGDWV